MVEEYNVWFRAWVRRQQQAQRVAAQPLVLEQVRKEWIGRRVRYCGEYGQGYAQATGVDAAGMVVLHFEQALAGLPGTFVVPLDALGVSVTHAD